MDRKILSALDRAANKLRNKIEGQDYFKVLLSIIFIKFLTTKTELEWNEFSKETASSYDDFILLKGKYDSEVTMVDQEFLWSNIRSCSDDELKSKLDGVFKSLEKHQDECKGMDIYKFSSSDVNVNTVRQIIELIENEVDFDSNDYVDTFGQIYEYFIAKYSTDAGRGGEFYTPHTIVNLMVSITEGRYSKDADGLKIYDPTMGSAGMLVQSLNYLTNEQGVSKDKLFFFGQELKNSTWSIAKMNFVLRGVQWNFGEKNDDTFMNDIFKGKKFDVILSNPPFNLDFPEEDYGHLRDDERFQDYGVVFGAGKANYNFFNHIINHMNDDGVAAVIMQPAAGKSNTPIEKEIRSKYLNENIVEAIISLPQSIFSNTSIASNIWIFNKGKKDEEVLFLDLQSDTIRRDKQEIFTDETINKVKELFMSRIKGIDFKSDLKYEFISNKDLIEKHNSELSVGNHVQIIEEIETVSKEDLIKSFNKILENSEQINERIKKAIKLLD